MQLGMIGLGRMGADMVRRLTRGGHECVVYDVHAHTITNLLHPGAVGASSLEDLAARLARPRVVWLMVPAAGPEQELATLVPLLDAGDIVIDGGNSFHGDDVQRGADLKQRGIHYVDVGTSGGVGGLDRGYCLMLGGEPDAVQRLAPIFATLAPGIDATPAPGRRQHAGTAEQAYLQCGPQGTRHFAKMVHNGIEYGLMAAYAEGLSILGHADAGTRQRDGDAEMVPMRNAWDYRYALDLPEVAEVWRRGSVIGAWLLELTAAALLDDPEVKGYAGRVSDSGEGRWTLAADIVEGVPAPVISSALFGRFASRGAADYAHRVLSAMRKQFGGHDENTAGGG